MVRSKKIRPSIHLLLPLPEVLVADALLTRGQVQVEGGHVLQYTVQRLLRVLLGLADAQIVLRREFSVMQMIL